MAVAVLVRAETTRLLRAGTPGLLAAALAVACDQQNWCPLCEAHPAVGHLPGCPLVQDLLTAGGVLEPEGH